MIPRALPAGRPSTLRIAVLLAIVAGLLVALVASPAALADTFTPESGGSPNADSIDSLYKIILYVAIVIFLIVEGTLTWSLVKYRARRGGPTEGAQIHGNTPLELGWTVGAAVILVVLSVVTFLYLGDIKNPAESGPNGLRAAATQFATIDQPDPPADSGSKPVVVDVNGQQYLWRYTYPNGASNYYNLVVPVDTTVILKITASDVIHSWWIPKMGGKMDAVPGYTNKAWFKASKEGSYIGQCAELCGAGHADMRALVTVVSPEEYTAFIERKKDEIDEAGKALAQQREDRERASSGASAADDEPEGTESIPGEQQGEQGNQRQTEIQ
jgi:cytochrome c oxidase subunit II